MTTASFADRLDRAIDDKGSPVCLGIDPQLELFPAPLAHLASSTNREVAAAAVQRFTDELLDAVSDLVAVVKPQVAFFERLGPPGWTALERLVREARSRGLLVIADAKRGDIASTAAAYADYSLGDAPANGNRPAVLPGLGADAMTVNPYLGADSLEPFLRHVDRGKGLYVLAKTSNPGALDLQDLRDRPTATASVRSTRTRRRWPRARAKRRSERAASPRSASWSAPRIRSRRGRCAPRTRRFPSWCPATARRAPAPPRSPALSTRAAAARSSTRRAACCSPIAASATRSSARRAGPKPPAASASRCATPSVAALAGRAGR